MPIFTHSRVTKRVCSSSSGPELLGARQACNYATLLTCQNKNLNLGIPDRVKVFSDATNIVGLTKPSDPNLIPDFLMDSDCSGGTQ